MKRTLSIICKKIEKNYLNWNRNSKKLRYDLKPLTCLWTFVSWSKLFSKKAIFCFCAWLPPSSSVSVSTLVWKNKQTSKQKDGQLITCLQKTTRVSSLCTRVRRKFHRRSYLCFHTTVKTCKCIQRRSLSGNFVTNLSIQGRGRLRGRDLALSFFLVF